MPLSDQNWNKESPTEPGYYWWRYGPDDDLPDLLYLYLSPCGIMAPNDDDPLHVSPPKELGGEWWPEKVHCPTESKP